MHTSCQLTHDGEKLLALRQSGSEARQNGLNGESIPAEIVTTGIKTWKKEAHQTRRMNCTHWCFCVECGTNGRSSDPPNERLIYCYRQKRMSISIDIETAADLVDDHPPSCFCNSGTIVNKSPINPTSATSKMGASASLLMATMVRASLMPVRC